MYLHSQTIIIAIDEPIFWTYEVHTSTKVKPVKIYIEFSTLQNGLKGTDECQW